MSAVNKKTLSEVNGSVEIKAGMSFRKKLLAFIGPAYLVSVGYMDPGNWATDIEGGSKYGYSLIWVLLLSNLMALLLQSLSVRLGVVRGRDLAQASRELYPKYINYFLYILAEIAIAACDLAEVLGMAIGLQLLFHIPLFWGVVICAFDTFVLLLLLHYGIRKIEAFIISLVAIIGIAFFAQIFIAQPVLSNIVSGFIPSFADDGALYIAIAIIGATVMPHNLYLHSSLVQTRKIERTPKEIKRALKFNFLDSTIALNIAFFVNMSILVVAATAFFMNGQKDVVDIRQAHLLLTPLLGSKVAPILFAVALICAGQSSTITGTLAGQIVMEGYLNIRIAPWLRRLITRLFAIIPALFVISIAGENATAPLLVFSQVILSLQLGFAVIPLIHFVSDKEKMGEFVISKIVKSLAWICALLIVTLNLKMVGNQLQHWIILFGWQNPKVIFSILLIIISLIVLVYISIYPFFSRNRERTVNLPHKKDLAIDDTIIMHPQRVALALDFTNADLSVIPQALRQGGKNATYYLIHISETANAQLLGTEAGDYETELDLDNLKKYKLQIEQWGYQCEIKMGYGRPRKEIARIAKESNADLLVMGAHGHKGISDLIFGSTIDAVRHNLTIPILVVR
jgi:manganese transport protein